MNQKGGRGRKEGRKEGSEGEGWHEPEEWKGKEGMKEVRVKDDMNQKGGRGRNEGSKGEG